MSLVSGFEKRTEVPGRTPETYGVVGVKLMKGGLGTGDTVKSCVVRVRVVSGRVDKREGLLVRSGTKYTRTTGNKMTGGEDTVDESLRGEGRVTYYRKGQDHGTNKRNLFCRIVLGTTEPNKETTG